MWGYVSVIRMLSVVVVVLGVRWASHAEGGEGSLHERPSFAQQMLDQLEEEEAKENPAADPEAAEAVTPEPPVAPYIRPAPTPEPENPAQGNVVVLLIFAVFVMVLLIVIVFLVLGADAHTRRHLRRRHRHALAHAHDEHPLGEADPDADALGDLSRAHGGNDQGIPPHAV